MSTTNNTKSTTKTQPFLTDVTELRRRARENIDKGALTEDYKGDVKRAVELLNGALATEIVCVLRYTMHWVTATGIASDAVKEEFKEHADEEREHMEWIADRIDQLGGTPDFDPKGLASRSSSEFGKAELNLVEMIKENLIAERIAIEHYRELVEYFGANDPTSRRLMEKILAKEEEHATDMHDLLVAHEGRPFLKK